jgi:small GTP-binding protein
MSEDDKIVFQPATESVFKVIVIGDPSVGKSSLLLKFSSKKFKEQYIPTVGVNITKEEVKLNDNGQDVLINLMLWDVAGQPQFYMLHKPYFNGADGMMLVFDITRSSTFSNVNNWYNTAVKHGLSGIPRVLIGNKIDLKDERKIIRPMATHLAEKLSSPYFETSALTGENVDLIFNKIAELCYQSKQR